MHPAQQPGPLEDREVAAHGLGGHAELAARSSTESRPRVTQLGYRLLALLGVHHVAPRRSLAGQGSTVTLIASPFLTIWKASRTRSRGMCSVIRSLTGTWPVEMYSSARLLCSGAEPLAPWMCSWR